MEHRPFISYLGLVLLCTILSLPCNKDVLCNPGQKKPGPAHPSPLAEGQSPLLPHDMLRGYGGPAVKQSGSGPAVGEANLNKALYDLADKLSSLILAVRNIIAQNQELINKDPETGNYSFKGLVPDVVGSRAASEFSLKTGIRIKETSLKVRNPDNTPDEWERQVLERMGSLSYLENSAFGEVVEQGGKKVYRYMRSLYISKPCLLCHCPKEEMRPEISKYIESHYPHDKAFGYKEGELRGGISITIPCEQD